MVSDPAAVQPSEEAVRFSSFSVYPLPSVCPGLPELPSEPGSVHWASCCSGLQRADKSLGVEPPRGICILAGIEAETKGIVPLQENFEHQWMNSLLLEWPSCSQRRRVIAQPARL